MNLHQWLSKLESPTYDRINLGLTRMRNVAMRCGIGNKLNCPVIMVAGTNGKGSSVALLENVYQNAGFKVGSYTSPHLIHFNERIKINTTPVDDNTIIKAFEFIDAKLEDTSLTYFEFATLAAMIILRNANLDLIILEIGLGGRLDACNIIDAQIALITSIGLDHQNYLGATRELIAREKAGIMRSGCPVVCSEAHPPKTIEQAADVLGAHLHCVNGDQQYNSSIHPNNIAGCKKIVDLMQAKYPISYDVFDRTVQTLCVAARQQIIQHNCQWIFDVAHNVQSISYLKKFLEDKQCSGKTIAVFSMLDDKDLKQCITQISGVIDQWHVIPIDHPRSIDVNDIKQSIAALTDTTIITYTQSMQAIAAIENDTVATDRVVVFGSFFTVAQLLTQLSLTRS